ncbi:MULTISPECIES: M3 family metallopeptidase [unclassified Microcystis]|uniref:oligopeptidase A n=3 Tax=Microcystis TaxID=1125 RepID=A0A552KTN4_9CHRO|nr:MULTISPECIES: M3 family metallopeptidase [unclassified Microcystis]MCA2815578.1 M3 family metallopeptidase [Microcystis sp. M085S1]MCA2853568.1 M3 family metallopeptidase [Microcystis sp. M065S1]TRT97202.1 MAG: M3 family peptidase [Microcystis flos-aquae Ma_QC_C_20070823_S18D]TRV11344.1 MAG: M3 family peptidase [Microcystis flos-aquae Mf_QC_C_20070823_S10D]TRV25377.1 MAG: M3 family peptidase [Microcystis flos-aquae Mf_QC_C_20070823_S10]TRV32882.1 MAG: M3 family peptidase [Microcystis flos-
MTNTSNPLLAGQGLPAFDQIQPGLIVPGMTQLLQELAGELTDLEAQIAPTWEKLVEPLTRIEERLSWSWGIIGHLMGVKNSPELRQAYETVQPQVVEFISRLSQSKPIYEAFLSLRQGESWGQLDETQQRIVEASLRDAQLAGVGLVGEKKDRFNAIQLELAEITTKFSNNILDATKAFQLKLTTPEDIAGLPPSLLSLAAQTARGQGETNASSETGPWVITLDFPSYFPFMKYSDNRELREKLYKAYVSRADLGELDNNPLIDRILQLRQEQAHLLGYSTYAEVSLARKMANSVDEIEKLLDNLRQVSYEAAKQDLEALKTFAGTDDLKHWDIAYWSEKQRQAKFNFSAEELRPYFPLPRVLEGIFSLAKRIFGVEIIAADGQSPIWHPDVRYFQINDEKGEKIAYFYLDAYSRPAEKRGGAWMDVCIGRAKTGTEVRLPVAYLICNQTPPVDGNPSLMTFEEVTTLFHEFGHGLQHMLTTVDYSGAAGINNVEWDAVELPSQFMENWCYDRPTLMSMAKHYETGETLPEHYYQKLLLAKNYMSGSAMLRQLHLSLVDLELHHRYQPNGGETPKQVRQRLAATTTIIPPLPEDAFLCSFGHIFAGGYAAGYYSYKWAEVLSADAFAAFEEVGLDNEEAVKAIGRRFRDTVLAMGGSSHPMNVFKAFRGREPSTEPLLRHSGL